MKSFYLIPVFCMLCFSPLLHASGGLINDGWREYDFQNFDGASRIFNEALKSSSLAATEKLQARIGLAMVVHYRIPGGNPEKALGMYRAILDSILQESPVRINLMLLSGRAFMGMKKPDLDSARAVFSAIIARYPGLLESDEAALEMGLMLSNKQTKNDFLAAITFLDAYCKQFPANSLASTMHMFCANLALSLYDYALGRNHLLMADSLGVVNIRNRPMVMYQIANLSDTRLGDPVTARKYYQKLITKYSTDYRAYFSQLRLNELEGKRP